MLCFLERRLVRGWVRKAIASKAQLLKDYGDEFSADRTCFGFRNSSRLAQTLSQQKLNAGLARGGQGFKVWEVQFGHRVIPIDWDQSRCKAYVWPVRRSTRKEGQFRVTKSGRSLELRRSSGSEGRAFIFNNEESANG